MAEVTGVAVTEGVEGVGTTTVVVATVVVAAVEVMVEAAVEAAVERRQ